MTRPVEIHYLEPGIRAVLLSPHGAVARDVLRRGLRAERLAKQHAPVDTGRLRASLHTVLIPQPSGWRVEIRSGVRYATWVERGTGLYGPYHQRIYPRTPNGFLVFRVRGRWVRVRSTRGMRPRWFLRYAIQQEFGFNPHIR